MIKRLLRVLLVLLCCVLIWPFLTLLAFVIVAIATWQGKKADAGAKATAKKTANEILKPLDGIFN